MTTDNSHTGGSARAADSATSNGAAVDNARRPAKAAWHYTPSLPITPSPYFRWPVAPVALLRWLFKGWFPVSERLIILLFAIASATVFFPSGADTSQLSAGWILAVLLRNMALMLIVAGGLHLYFYVFRCQGDHKRYDARPLATGNRTFTFGGQVKDNMFWTLVSGVPVWTAYEVLMLWALANGFAPALSMPGDWMWLVVLIVLLPVWETTHFFLIHRIIHKAPFYKRIHALHHRNTNVGPWSGLSMHPIEHLVYLSTVLIHFVVPSNPLLIMFHLQYFALSAATTHTGYQGILWGERLILPLGTFHHQLHHRYFSCNYGGLEVPWDQWTGSFHDGTDESHRQFLKNRRRAT